MSHDILFALWFLLPAAAANVTPIISAHLPLLKQWNTPIDGGHTFHGKELFGTHKTWRGLISGMFVATIVLWLQQVLFQEYSWAQTLTGSVNYSSLPILILGPLFGFGALAGDAIESFFKRQRGVPSGKKWVPFDQLDYVVGGVLVSLPFVILSLRQYLIIFVLWVGIHFAASYIGYLVGLKEDPV
ncbi:hypothetical protein CYG49_01695 [Candidatus Saccharibacteria bacterium]|nr:MAG: hypothetical protein CYG49_01695 [Candidatus Saccharibacteria bacterium]